MTMFSLACVPSAAAQASTQGQWRTLPNLMPINPVHVALMHNGKVLLLTDSTATVVWDPAGQPEVLSGDVTGLTDILYCSGHSFLSDGRLLAVGESFPFGGVTAEVIARVTNEGFHLLDAPPQRINAKDTPIPYHPNLWSTHRPSGKMIAAKARQLLRE